MASELKVDKFTGVTTAGSILVTGEGNSTTTNLQQGLMKAWCQNTDPAVITDSLNIASGTDNSTGNYDLTFTNAMGNTMQELIDDINARFKQYEDRQPQLSEVIFETNNEKIDITSKIRTILNKGE